MTENMELSPTVLEQLIKDLGIDQLSPDKQQEIVNKLTDVLLKRIFLETMQKLGQQGQEEYEKMAEGEVSPDQIEAFFRERIPNYDDMVMSVIEEFKQEMLNANIL